MRRTWLAVLAAAMVVVACGGSDAPPLVFGSDPPTSTTATDDTAVELDADVHVRIDPTQPGAEISPLVSGISGDLSAEEMTAAGMEVNSWGGNPASRYNYQVGHFWNAALDWEFRNTDYEQDGDSFRSFADLNLEAGIETRLAVPTLGWIAKDATSCSFPDDAGGCTGASGANCENPDVTTDPRATSVESTPESVAQWVADLSAEGRAPRFIALDNEPELWGYTHYDIHPECPTYEEIRDRYLEYATAIREVAPDAELMGPAMCCWYDYWRNAPGPADGSDADFLTWFLTEIRRHDEETGVRTLDVVDVHFYPQSGIYNDEDDADTNARRLRSVRSLYDPIYSDESWIVGPIEFVPRMLRTIEASYPGTPLAISEWNFGADGTMNGALAIADVLGVYGREGVYAAMYWRAPKPGSPGYHAFAMHGNYDGRGSRFGGAVLPTESDDVEAVGAYAALDSAAGLTRVMLINKDPDAALTVALDVGALGDTMATRFTYGPADLTAIVTDTVDVAAPVELPASSITVLELATAG